MYFFPNSIQFPPGGDSRNDFYIGRETGSILLAHKLDYEAQNEYTLNISVTDSVHTVYTQLNVSVIDINDHRPEFSETLYKVEISEAVPVETEILRLRATDKDDNTKLIYSLHSARNLISLQTFKVDSITGVIYLTDNLDRESLDEHILTVMVRDGGTPAKRNYARVKIIVHDHNDHVPHFSEQILEGKVFESAVVSSYCWRHCCYLIFAFVRLAAPFFGPSPWITTRARTPESPIPSFRVISATLSP